MIRQWFTEHPASVNETYSQHFCKAISFSWQLFKASLACLIHAVFPACCVKTGSQAIKDLHDKMVTFRVQNPSSTDKDGASEEPTIEYMI